MECYVGRRFTRLVLQLMDWVYYVCSKEVTILNIKNNNDFYYNNSQNANEAKKSRDILENSYTLLYSFLYSYHILMTS